MKCQSEKSTSTSNSRSARRMFRKSSAAATFALAAFGVATSPAFAWIDLPTGSVLSAAGPSPSLPVGSATRSIGIQSGTYQLRVNRLTSGETIPAAFCEDWVGNLKSSGELNRDLESLSLRVETTPRVQRGNILTGPVQVQEARLIYRMASTGSETGTQYVDAAGIKQRMSDPTGPILGTKCSMPIGNSGARDCNSTQDDIGSIQFSKASPSGEIQMRIMKPELWGFSAAVVNLCANIVLVLNPVSDSSSSIQSASR